MLQWQNQCVRIGFENPSICDMFWFMKHAIAIVLTFFTIAITTTAFAGAKCKCRFKGGYIEEGKTACLKTPNGSSLARCEKVLNNTSWKTLNLPCPVASLKLENDSLKNQTPFPAGWLVSAITKSKI